MSSTEPTEITGTSLQEVEDIFFLLGEEMGNIPKAQRDEIFGKLIERIKVLRSAEPPKIAHVFLTRFMAGWINGAITKFD